MTQNEKRLIELIKNYPNPEEAFIIAMKIIEQFLECEQSER